MAVQARFYIASLTKKPDGTADVNLQAVTSKENARWSQYTPSGTITMSLTRAASGALRVFEEAVDRARARGEESPKDDYGSPMKSYRPECLVTFDFDVPDAEDPGRAQDETGKDIGYATDE
jgi:hypothetical protein